MLGSFDPHTSLVASAYDNVFGAAKQQAKLPGSPEGGDQPGDGREESKEAQKNSDFAGDPSANFDPATPENQQDQNKQEASNKDQGADGGKKKTPPAKTPPLTNRSKATNSRPTETRTPSPTPSLPCSIKSAKPSTTC